MNVGWRDALLMLQDLALSNLQNILSAIKKIEIKELRDFIYENYCRQIGFTNENSFYSMKRQKKDLLSFVTKLIEKYLILVTLTNTMNFI